jgi:hypothetical protein
VSIFKQIDSRLVELSMRLNAKLTKDRPEYPEALRTFEERRIDWMDGEVNKAIIIQPNFEVTGVNSKIWNFILLAWHDDGQSLHRAQWIKILVEKKKFEIIENDIDNLFRISEATLTKITQLHLK